MILDKIHYPAVLKVSVPAQVVVLKSVYGMLNPE